MQCEDIRENSTGGKLLTFWLQSIAITTRLVQVFYCGAMQQDFASLSGFRKRCGACLFELDPQTKSLSFDADYNLERVFKSFGIYEVNYKHLEYSSSRGCEKCKGLITILKQCKLSFNIAQWCRAYGRLGPRPRLMLDSSTQLELCVSLHEFEEDMFSVLLRGRSCDLRSSDR
jgi:hypothetical protein